MADRHTVPKKPHLTSCSTKTIVNNWSFKQTLPGFSSSFLRTNRLFSHNERRKFSICCHFLSSRKTIDRIASEHKPCLQLSSLATWLSIRKPSIPDFMRTNRSLMAGWDVWATQQRNEQGEQKSRMYDVSTNRRYRPSIRILVNWSILIRLQRGSAGITIHRAGDADRIT